MQKLLEELCQAPGVPGREQKIIDIMKRELEPLCDELNQDSYGNVLALKKSKKKNPLRVMIAGHMDEIGFVVSHISEKGFVYFSPRGGHSQIALNAQRVKLYGKKTLDGVICSHPPLPTYGEKDKLPDLADMYVDTGLSAAEVKKVLAMGDPIVMDGPFVSQGDMHMSKAFDNRVGCYMVIETLRKLKSKKLDVELCGLGSAQEEVGVRGARAAAKDYNPDIGIALDVTSAMDIPGIKEHRRVSALGEGVAIKINDSGSISNHGIVKHFRSLAKKHKIRYQDEILPFGGTDAMGMQLFGSGAVGCLSIPTRHVHSANEIINRNDLAAGINLLVRFVETAHQCKLEF